MARAATSHLSTTNQIGALWNLRQIRTGSRRGATCGQCLGGALLRSEPTAPVGRP